MPTLNSRSADFPERLRSALAGRYTLDRELGRGGMATVFLAHDLKHRRRVALKVLHPDLAYALGPDRFLREIHTAAGLAHPHILPLFDSGEADGLLWYTMPYVEGESLRTRLTRERQLAVVDAVRIAVEVADALSHAHEHGIIHRDIKPENILLSGSHAFVADFGVATALEAAATERLTRTGIAVGTPAYMSPEQAGADRDVDHRSDVYALGCVLYETLAGEPPYTGPTPRALIARRLTDPVPSLSLLRPTVPQWLDRAVQAALAPLPADRCPSAAQFARSLAPPAGAEGPQVPLEPSIAVLPFASMSADPEAEYFADGVAEDILNALTHVQHLQVAARTSAFAFKGKSADVSEIGRKLKVATVLEGSVRKAGNRLRITAQLIDVGNGYHLWSERYDREMADVFAIQDDIAQNIVGALRLVLTEQERRAIQSQAKVNVEAYEYYLRGRQLFHQFRRKSLDFALQMFARAIAIEPGFARAYAGIADCHCRCALPEAAGTSGPLYEQHDPGASSLEQADAASRRALELDPESAEAHASRGQALSLQGRFDEARRAFEAAIRLAPKLFEAHYFFARACFLQGDREEALWHFEDAARVRPEDFQSRSLLASVLSGLGRKEEAMTVHAGALQVIERHLELYPDDARAIYMGANSLLQLGEVSRAFEWAARALAVDPADTSILYNVACVYALAGRSEDALDCLERAARLGMRNRAWVEQDSDLDSLRSHARFVTLLTSL
jgi:TolB-like protein/Flp pilus assembly protein TadD/tRNA A-37 threonylcarbamoyl transferase component Bud32